MSYRTGEYYDSFDAISTFVGKVYRAIEWVLHAEFMCKDRWWERQ